MVLLFLIYCPLLVVGTPSLITRPAYTTTANSGLRTFLNTYQQWRREAAACAAALYYYLSFLLLANPNTILYKIKRANVAKMLL